MFNLSAYVYTIVATTTDVCNWNFSAMIICAYGHRNNYDLFGTYAQLVCTRYVLHTAANSKCSPYDSRAYHRIIELGWTNEKITGACNSAYFRVRVYATTHVDNVKYVMLFSNIAQ